MHSASGCGGWFTPSMSNAHCSWVGLRSYYKEIALGSLNPTQLKKNPWYGRFATECNCCVHTGPHELHWCLIGLAETIPVSKHPTLTFVLSILTPQKWRVWWIFWAVCNQVPEDKILNLSWLSKMLNCCVSASYRNSSPGCAIKLLKMVCYISLSV